MVSTDSSTKNEVFGILPYYEFQEFSGIRLRGSSLKLIPEVWAHVSGMTDSRIVLAPIVLAY